MDKPLQVVRLRVEFQSEGDRVACLVGDMDAPRDTLRDVLSIDRDYAADDDIFSRFQTLGAAIAAKRGEALGAAAGVDVRATGMVSDETGMLAAAHASDDAHAMTGEFEVAVGQEGDRVCAYLVSFHGQRLPAGASPPLATVPADFMGDAGVQMQFRNLLEAIGLCLARSDMDDDKQSDAPVSPRLQ